MTYKGQIVNGILNGKGKLTLSNGVVYKGQMIDNKIDNHGKLEYSKTESYEGDLKDLHRHGFGIY